MKFFSNNWRGLAIFGLGALTVVLALTVLHVCGDEGHMLKTATGSEVAMRCTWTRMGVVGIGGLVALTGLIMMFAREAARAMSLVAAGAGALIVATPLWLIPTCASPMMECNMSFKPGALILGGLTMLVGLAGSLNFVRSGRMAIQA